jgi:hypothetical protein
LDVLKLLVDSELSKEITTLFIRPPKLVVARKQVELKSSPHRNLGMKEKEPLLVVFFIQRDPHHDSVRTALGQPHFTPHSGGGENAPGSQQYDDESEGSHALLFGISVCGLREIN